jgi:type III secretory pathway component EscR
MSRRRFPQDYPTSVKVVVLVSLLPLLPLVVVMGTGLWLAIALSVVLHMVVGIAEHGTQPFTLDMLGLVVTTAAFGPACWWLSYRRGWFS